MGADAGCPLTAIPSLVYLLLNKLSTILREKKIDFDCFQELTAGKSYSYRKFTPHPQEIIGSLGISVKIPDMVVQLTQNSIDA